MTQPMTPDYAAGYHAGTVDAAKEAMDSWAPVVVAARKLYEEQHQQIKQIRSELKQLINADICPPLVRDMAQVILTRLEDET